MMEGTLESAVKIGADNLLRQVKAAVPDPPMLTGAPEVHGFRLDGYGIFFDVGVPMLRLPVTWPLRYMINSDNRDLEILAAELKQLIAQMDARYQPQFAQVVRRLEIASPGAGPVALRGPAGDGGGQSGAGRSAGRRCTSARQPRRGVHARGQGGAHRRDDREQRAAGAWPRGVADGRRARQRSSRSADSRRHGRLQHASSSA